MDYDISRKKILNVLDCIGNYEKVGRVRFFLAGQAAAFGTNVSEKEYYLEIRRRQKEE